jgi:hypothetical protein
VAKVEHTTGLFNREKGAIVGEVCHQLCTINLWVIISCHPDRLHLIVTGVLELKVPLLLNFAQ